MRVLRRLVRFGYIVYVLIGFSVAVVCLFFLALLAVFLPDPTNGHFMYASARQFARVLFFCWGIRIEQTHTALIEPHRPYIFIFNHISYLDAIVLLFALENRHFRGLGKQEIAAIPVFGFIYRSTVIMVKRNDPDDRARSVERLKQALQKNISIALAPEGTFNMTQKPLLPFFDGAFRIAVQTQTPICPILFLDTYDRLHYDSLFSLKPGVVRIKFLPPIDPVWQGKALTLYEMKSHAQHAMHDALIINNASWIRPAHD
jgi:1-acyl-sn-glycerol-3-phosphate acyltransferase